MYDTTIHAAQIDAVASKIHSYIHNLFILKITNLNFNLTI